MLQKHYPDDLKTIFAGHAIDLLSAKWIRDHNGGGKGKAANNNGLVQNAGSSARLPRATRGARPSAC